MQPGNFDLAVPLGDYLRARWSQRQDKTFMEEDVLVVSKSSWGWVILCRVSIREQTQVYLTGQKYTGNGIVCSCKRDGAAYILTLAMLTEDCYQPVRHDFDAGVLGVDSFLTEEAESKILESLKDDAPFSGMVQRGMEGGILRILAGSLYRLLPGNLKASSLLLLFAS